jgi:hypothetical protein
MGSAPAAEVGSAAEVTSLENNKKTKQALEIVMIPIDNKGATLRSTKSTFRTRLHKGSVP